MYTYVFAFYLKKNNQSEIFEVIFFWQKRLLIRNFMAQINFYLKANQKDLETATETLSEYLERDITSENLADIKQKVQDKYR